jgi:uncharacterized protein with PQ loop repeat
MNDWTCEEESIITYTIGVLLCIGGILSYLPQYMTLIKSRQAKGISELSLFILNVGSFFLACNSLILNWWKFECYQHCTFFLCTGNLLAFYQICLGWIIVFPLYIIYICMQYKENNYENQDALNRDEENRDVVKKEENVVKKCCTWNFSSNQRKIYELMYVILYAIFFLVVVILLTIEKFTYDNVSVLKIIAYILGILSMICSGIVWVPQIIKLIRTKENDGLSLFMFLIQTPGSAIIIVFQAILNKQNVTTWISYLFNFVEQLIIIVILLILKVRKYKERKKLRMKELEEIGQVLEEDGIF